jgi:helicase
LIEHNLINYVKKDTEKLFPTRAGILINSRRIDLDTYLLFKGYLENKRGKLNNLELITLLTKSGEGKTIPIPFPQFNQITDRYKIGKSKINKEKVKNIFTVVSKRGVMLKLKADQIKIN